MLTNINRLITQAGRCKAGFLSDQAELNNALFVGVTETWLSDKNFDAEVTHKFPGYNFYHVDRSGGRDGGGGALYLSERLTGDIIASYDNSVCGLLIVKIYELDSVVCVCYRPPDTTLAEFKDMIAALDKALSDLPAPTPNILVMGDFNFPRTVMNWNRSEDGHLIPIVKQYRVSETNQGKRDRIQAQLLVDTASKFCLNQEVERPTHAVEILDLIFTNNPDLITTVNETDFPQFTDHRVISVQTSFRLSVNFIHGCPDQVEQHLCSTGARYKSLDFNKAPWDKVREELAKVQWDEVKGLAKDSPSKALETFHDKILEVLEKEVPKKKLQTDKSKSKMHRLRRKLWKRHAKAKRQVRSASNIQQISNAIQAVWKAGRQLAEDYLASDKMEEDQAVLSMKQDPRKFFNFVRAKQKTKAGVGPFLENGKPNPNPDYAAKQLKQQYDSVFAQPRSEWSVNDPSTHFKAESDDNSALSDIEFTVEDIKNACKELRNSAAPGPDGVPALLLKVCRNELSVPLFHIWRASLDTSEIPLEQLLVLICPLHKGGSRSIPKNYRPVALTSHIIKVFERVVRRALVTHIDILGILPGGQHGSRSMRSTLT